MKSVQITLTTAGADTGPFDIYGNHDNYNAAIVTNIATVKAFSPLYYSKNFSSLYIVAIMMSTIAW